jgi:thioredoxin 1
VQSRSPEETQPWSSASGRVHTETDHATYSNAADQPGRVSDADDTDKLAEIREQKRQQLLAEAEGETRAESTSDETNPSTPSEPIHVDGSEAFTDHLATHDVALVDFYADWCGPCKQLEPIVAELAAGTDAAVLKVDIDAHQGLAAEYGVRSVPTLVVFEGGDVVEQVVGVHGKDRLAGLVGRYT